jgi:hypothetical protein
MLVAYLQERKMQLSMQPNIVTIALHSRIDRMRVGVWISVCSRNRKKPTVHRHEHKYRSFGNSSNRNAVLEETGTARAS